MSTMSAMSARTRTEFERVSRTIFRRCVECPPQVPNCAELKCAASEICVQVPPDCNTCAHVTCQPADVDPTNENARESKGPNVGAIAGGVVGGVIFIAVVTFIIWRFCLKGRRRTYAESEWQEEEMPQQEKMDPDFASRRSTRASTHTVASMASSVLTRASNIIQIAYIPGVTNRSGLSSPDILVPPVPPIPAMSPSTLSSPYSTSEQHFFVPDFRDSIATVSTDPRSSYARTSIATSLARGSVASTMYRQNAIVSPLPAQTIVRGKAAVVSVKSTGSSSPSDVSSVHTPPVPQIDPKHSAQTVRVLMPRQTSNTSLSPSNSFSGTTTVGKVRALNITKKKPTLEKTPSHNSGSGSTFLDSENALVSPTETLVPKARPLTEISMASTDDGFVHERARRMAEIDSDSETDDDDHFRARQSLLRNSAVTDIQDTPPSSQGPFADKSSAELLRPDLLQRHTSTSSALRPPMTPISEESSKRGSRVSKRTQSPFSDDNKSEL